MNGTATPTRTGLFEVQLGENGPLLWSKKASGKCDYFTKLNK